MVVVTSTMIETSVYLVGSIFVIFTFAASLIIAVSFFFFYLKDAFILNLGIMLIIGVGIGGYEGAADFEVTNTGIRISSPYKDTHIELHSNGCYSQMSLRTNVK